MTPVPIMLILSLLTLVRLVAASSSLKIINLNKDLNIRDLVVARQSSTGASTMVPTECKSICDPINAVIAQECPVQICCQSSFVTDYASCLECVGNALGAHNFTAAQQALNNLTMTCDSLGAQVSSLSLPGPEASGALPSASATVTPNLPPTDAPANSTNAPIPFTIVPAQSANTPAQVTNAPAQSTNASAQSTTATSSAKQSCLIPHLSRVQASVFLLGGLIHLAL